MNNNTTRAVTHSLPTDNCPVCQAPYNGVINIIDQQSRGPRHGDVVVCPGCRTFLVFKLASDQQSLKIIELTDDEIVELPQEVKDQLRRERRRLCEMHEQVVKNAESIFGQRWDGVNGDPLKDLLRWLKDEP